MVQQSLEETLIDLARTVRTDHAGGPHDTGGPSHVSIRLDGAALQQEGITRNQQIRDFHRSNERLSDNLDAVVDACQSGDHRAPLCGKGQKLVWYLDAARGEIVVSTRAATSAARIELPIEFTDPDAALTSSP